MLGFTGLLLFNSRFWVQWWSSEKRDSSYLGASFWWLSLIGDTLCLIYFIRLGDIVNLAGPLFGLIPYIRNLMLIKKNSPSMNPKRSS
jgi:lipid-A-disaccharide synthase